MNLLIFCAICNTYLSRMYVSLMKPAICINYNLKKTITIHVMLTCYYYIHSLLMSPLWTVILNLEQYCSHSGGGTNVHVFLPESCACHEGLPTRSIYRCVYLILMHGRINIGLHAYQLLVLVLP